MSYSVEHGELKFYPPLTSLTENSTGGIQSCLSAVMTGPTEPQITLWVSHRRLSHLLGTFFGTFTPSTNGIDSRC